jgi:hypothetical protein
MTARSVDIVSRVRAGIRPVINTCEQLGISPRKLADLRLLPRYLRDYAAFRRLGGVATHRHMVLSDYGDNAGTASGHYFHQDLLVAQFIAEARPVRHVDVGSRIDGFVAHVASFRSIEILDVRSLPPLEHPRISFLRADLMNPESVAENSTDSLSCLHALEHFGLGRYGDPIAPLGHLSGFANLVRMLESGGTLYVSFPIASRRQVHFNAHRIFHPQDIFDWPTPRCTLLLKRFDYVDDTGHLHLDTDPKRIPETLRYGCGIYTFAKQDAR